MYAPPQPTTIGHTRPRQPATPDILEQTLANFLAVLADLASTAGETERVGRLLNAAEALGAAEPRPAAVFVAGSPLSEREFDVAQLIARGLTNRQIGQELIISERTVDTHVQNILSKLRLASRAQVAVWVTEAQS